MAVSISTKSPRALWKKFCRAIQQDKIVTWELDDDDDLTHSSPQWSRLAWFRPAFYSEGKLVMGLVAPRAGVSKVTYAVYHGRLIAAFLSHFDDDISAISASPQATKDDIL